LSSSTFFAVINQSGTRYGLVFSIFQIQSPSNHWEFSSPWNYHSNPQGVSHDQQEEDRISICNWVEERYQPSLHESLKTRKSNIFWNTETDLKSSWKITAMLLRLAWTMSSKYHILLFPLNLITIIVILLSYSKVCNTLLLYCTKLGGISL